MEGCCPVHQTSHYPAKNIFCHVSRKGQYIYKRVSRYLSAVTPLKTRMDCNLFKIPSFKVSEYPMFSVEWGSCSELSMEEPLPAYRLREKI